jgi:hypothetical protein
MSLGEFTGQVRSTRISSSRRLLAGGRIPAIETEIVARSVFAESLCRLQIIRIETLRGSGDTSTA